MTGGVAVCRLALFSARHRSAILLLSRRPCHITAVEKPLASDRKSCCCHQKQPSISPLPQLPSSKPVSVLPAVFSGQSTVVEEDVEEEDQEQEKLEEDRCLERRFAEAPLYSQALADLARLVVNEGWLPELNVVRRVKANVEKAFRNLRRSGKLPAPVLDQLVVNVLHIAAVWPTEFYLHEAPDYIVRWLSARLDELPAAQLFQVLQRLGQLSSLSLDADLAGRLARRALQLLSDISPDEAVFAVSAFDHNSTSVANACPALWPEWFEFSRLALSKMSPKSLAQCLHSLASQRKLPPYFWWTNLHVALYTKMADLDGADAASCLHSFAKLRTIFGELTYDERMIGLARQLATRWHAELATMELDAYARGIECISQMPIPASDLAASFKTDVRLAGKRVITPEAFQRKHLALLNCVLTKGSRVHAIPWHAFDTALSQQVLDRLDVPSLCQLLYCCARAGILVEEERRVEILKRIEASAQWLSAQDLTSWASALALMGLPIDDGLWGLCAQHFDKFSDDSLARLARIMLLSTVSLDQTLPAVLLSRILRRLLGSDKPPADHRCLLQRFRLLLGAFPPAITLPPDTQSEMQKDRWLDSVQSQMADWTESDSTTWYAPAADSKYRESLEQAISRYFSGTKRNVPVPEAACVAPLLICGLASGERLVVQLDGFGQHLVDSKGKAVACRRPGSQLREHLLHKAGYTVVVVSVFEWQQGEHQQRRLVDRLRKSYRRTEL